MSRLVQIVFYLGLVAALAAACSSAAGEPKPPEIAYGHDMCDACGMLIDSPQFAAAVVLEDGKALKYDDIAEMIKYHQAHPELQVKAWFVHDYDTQAWIRAEEAVFVQSREIKSPMGGGVAAFSGDQDGRGRAEAFAQQVGGKLLTFEELLKMKMMMGHGG